MTAKESKLYFPLLLLATAATILVCILIYYHQSNASVAKKEDDVQLHLPPQPIVKQKPRIESKERSVWLDVQMPTKSWYYGFDPPNDPQRWRTAQQQVCSLYKNQFYNSYHYTYITSHISLYRRLQETKCYCSNPCRNLKDSCHF